MIGENTPTVFFPDFFEKPFVFSNTQNSSCIESTHTVCFPSAPLNYRFSYSGITHALCFTLTIPRKTLFSQTHRNEFIQTLIFRRLMAFSLGENPAIMFSPGIFHHSNSISPMFLYPGKTHPLCFSHPIGFTSDLIHGFQLIVFYVSLGFLGENIPSMFYPNVF